MGMHGSGRGKSILGAALAARARAAQAHLRNVRRVVAAVVLHVVTRTALVAQPAAQREVPAPRRLMQRPVALPLDRQEINALQQQIRGCRWRLESEQISL